MTPTDKEMEAAYAAIMTGRVEAVAMLVLKERERCARLVETWAQDDECVQPAFTSMVAAIRAGK